MHTIHIRWLIIKGRYGVIERREVSEERDER
jgi:hypothetical protein